MFYPKLKGGDGRGGEGEEKRREGEGKGREENSFLRFDSIVLSASCSLEIKAALMKEKCCPPLFWPFGCQRGIWEEFGKCRKSPWCFAACPPEFILLPGYNASCYNLITTPSDWDTSGDTADDWRKDLTLYQWKRLKKTLPSSTIWTIVANMVSSSDLLKQTWLYCT